MKAIAVFKILCAVAYFLFPFFSPWPGAPNLYNRLLVLTSVLISGLRMVWPKFRGFSRRLPLAVRLFIIASAALMVFMDMKKSGFTPYTLFGIIFGISVVEFSLGGIER